MLVVSKETTRQDPLFIFWHMDIFFLCLNQTSSSQAFYLWGNRTQEHHFPVTTSQCFPERLRVFSVVFSLQLSPLKSADEFHTLGGRCCFPHHKWDTEAYRGWPISFSVSQSYSQLVLVFHCDCRSPRVVHLGNSYIPGGVNSHLLSAGSYITLRPRIYLVEPYRTLVECFTSYFWKVLGEYSHYFPQSRTEDTASHISGK